MTQNLVKADKNIYDDHNNLTNLTELSEPSLLFSLRKRFYEDQIYTNIGPILVSINPFKQLPFYTSDVLKACISGEFGSPHVFTLASKCFNQLIENKQSQSCIVTGESGAGKTEATKLIIQCLTEKSSISDSSSNDRGNELQKRILEVNPLLEAFGNARTSRNDNSSRFGKLTQLFLSPSNGTITGVGIIDYLLEKSRIVQQTKGERNYHIFYQMLSDVAICQEYNLKYAEKYYYLTQSGDPNDVVCETLNDSADWKETIDSMEVLGISAQEVSNIEKILVGILNLGNIQFVSNGEKDPASFANGKTCEWTKESCLKFGFNVKKVQYGLLSTAITVRGETTHREHTVQQAIVARDALAKSIYSALSGYLIKRVNEELKGKESGHNLNINVLDIFGFESFKFNSFEQLCINYCNEKLQVHFIDNIFKTEEKAYLEEGIKVKPIQFVDTSEVLEIIEGRSVGLYSILDEQNKLPTGSDEMFLKKVLNNANRFKTLTAPKGNDVRKYPFMKYNFIIQHFAGKVSYNVTNFLEKNSDKLLVSLQQVTETTTFPFLKELFDKFIKTGKKSTSLGLKFKNQLNELLFVLNSSQPHFVRTIKPNPEKVRDRIDSHLVLEQIKCAGLIGVCEVHKNGFPSRYTFKDFLFKFNLIVNNQARDAQELAQMLEQDNILPAKHWQSGKTQIFLRTAYAEELETLREERLGIYATKIQKVGRGLIARIRYSRLRAVVFQLQDAIDSDSVEELTNAIEAANKLPRVVALEQLMYNARETLADIKEGREVIEDLKAAVDKKDLNLIQSLLNATERMNLRQVQGQSIILRANKILEAEGGRTPELRFDFQNGNVADFLMQVWEKMQSNYGISDQDLAQLQDLVSQIASGAVPVEDYEKELPEAEGLLDFAKLQLEVQDFVAVALESQDEEDIMAALDLVQQIDLQTSSAKKLINLIVSREEEKQHNAARVPQRPNDLRALATSVRMQGQGGTTREKVMMSMKMVPPRPQGKMGGSVFGSYMTLARPNNRLSAVVNMSTNLGNTMAYMAPRMESTNGRANMLSVNLKNVMNANPNFQSAVKQGEDNGNVNNKIGQYNVESFYLLRPEGEREAVEWSGKPLTVSLTVLNDNYNKLAVELNRSVLQYSGDEKFQYPSSAAQRVIQTGIDNPYLNNEIYLQVMKNLTNNKKPSSEDRSWILMILVTQMLPPARELQPFVVSFLKRFAKIPLKIGNFAKLCMAQLDRTMELGASPVVPDVDLITQYSTRPAILLEITTCRREYLNGELTTVSIPCYPDTDVDTIIECASEIVGYDPRKVNTYGLFVSGKKVSIQSVFAARLERFYSKWDPSKLKHVEYFATMYNNKEEELFDQLIQKYGPEPEGDLSLETNRVQVEKEDVTDDELYYPLPWWMFPGDIFMKLSFKGKEAYTRK